MCVSIHDSWTKPQREKPTKFRYWWNSPRISTSKSILYHLPAIRILALHPRQRVQPAYDVSNTVWKIPLVPTAIWIVSLIRNFSEKNQPNTRRFEWCPQHTRWHPSRWHGKHNRRSKRRSQSKSRGTADKMPWAKHHSQQRQTEAPTERSIVHGSHTHWQRCQDGPRQSEGSSRHAQTWRHRRRSKTQWLRQLPGKVPAWTGWRDGTLTLTHSERRWMEMGWG